MFTFYMFSALPPPNLKEWAARAERCDNLSVPVKIAMVGKYTGLSDSYLSVLKVSIQSLYQSGLLKQTHIMHCNSLFLHFRRCKLEFYDS